MGGKEVEVLTGPGGPTRVKIAGQTRERMEALGVNGVLLTLSHCRAYATATAIAFRHD